MSMFLEPGYSFDISHRILLLAEKEINDGVIPHLIFSDQFSIDNNLGIIITTKKGVADLVVDKEKRIKRYKAIDHYIWIPFEKVTESNDYVFSYLNYLFEGINRVFQLHHLEALDLVKLSCERVKNIIELNPDLRINSDDDILKMYQKSGMTPPWLK